MTTEERDLITGLFTRLRSADSGAKDAEAEQLIRQQIDALPSAPYLLTQTLFVQEHALQNAQARIAALERQAADATASAAAARPQPSFLSGLFHHDATPTPPPPLRPPAPSPFASTLTMPSSGGGGFLRGALATAAGVAGGSLLFEGIENLLGHRPGAFASGLGGFGGFGSQSQYPENVEVVNNYYDGAPGGGGGAQDPGMRVSEDLPMDQPVNDPAYDDSSSFSDPTPSDSGTDFDPGSGGGDSLV